MSKFKMGQRVILTELTSDDASLNLKVGDVGEVVNLTDYGVVGVRFDEKCMPWHVGEEQVAPVKKVFDMITFIQTCINDGDDWEDLEQFICEDGWARDCVGKTRGEIEELAYSVNPEWMKEVADI